MTTRGASEILHWALGRYGSGARVQLIWLSHNRIEISVKEQPDRRLSDG